VNALLIHADLETFHEYGSECDTEFKSGRNPFVPCPYITMLYHAVTGIGVDDGRHDNSVILDANLRHRDCSEYHEQMQAFMGTKERSPR